MGVVRGEIKTGKGIFVQLALSQRADLWSRLGAELWRGQRPRAEVSAELQSSGVSSLAGDLLCNAFLKCVRHEE